MEKLEINIIDQPDINGVIFKLKGAIDVFSYRELKISFDAWVEGSYKPALLLDMTEVGYVGSSGWSVIFLQTVAQEQQGGMLVLFGMGDRVDRSLNIIMPRKRHVNVAPNLEAAKGLVETLKNSAQAAQT